MASNNCDVRVLLSTLRDRGLTAIDELSNRNQEHAVELAGDVAPRQAREARRLALCAVIIRLSGTLEGVYGDGILMVYGLAG